MNHRELEGSVSHVTSNPGWRSRLITLVAGGAAIVYAVFVFVPVQRAVSQTRKTIRSQQSQIVKSVSLAKSIQEAEAKLATTEEFIGVWRAQTPTPKHLPAVYSEIISLAQDHGAEVTSLLPQAEQPLNTIGLVPVVLQSAGSYQSLRGLLIRLETMSGRVWVEEVHLQPLDKQSDRLSGTIKLIIFTNRDEISS